MKYDENQRIGGGAGAIEPDTGLEHKVADTSVTECTQRPYDKEQQPGQDETDGYAEQG